MPCEKLVESGTFAQYSVLGGESSKSDFSFDKNESSAARPVRFCFFHDVAKSSFR